MKETLEVLDLSQERISDRIGEWTFDGLVSRVTKEIVEVARLIPQECIQERVVEQRVDTLVCPIMEENRGTCANTPQEHSMNESRNKVWIS